MTDAAIGPEVSLRGRLLCDLCGRKLDRSGGQPGSRYFRCKNPKCALDGAVPETAVRRLVGDDASTVFRVSRSGRDWRLVDVDEKRGPLVHSPDQPKLLGDRCAWSIRRSDTSQACHHCFATVSDRRVEWDHFPIAKRYGGRDVVPACVDCHDYTDRGLFWRLPDTVQREMSEGAFRLIAELGGMKAMNSVVDYESFRGFVGDAWDTPGSATVRLTTVIIVKSMISKRFEEKGLTLSDVDG